MRGGKGEIFDEAKISRGSFFLSCFSFYKYRKFLSQNKLLNVYLKIKILAKSFK